MKNKTDKKLLEFPSFYSIFSVNSPCYHPQIYEKSGNHANFSLAMFPYIGLMDKFLSEIE